MFLRIISLFLFCGIITTVAKAQSRQALLDSVSKIMLDTPVPGNLATADKPFFGFVAIAISPSAASKMIFSDSIPMAMAKNIRRHEERISRLNWQGAFPRTDQGGNSYVLLPVIILSSPGSDRQIPLKNAAAMFLSAVNMKELRNAKVYFAEAVIFKIL